MGRGGEDDQRGRGHGQEEDEEQDAVDHEADLLPLDGELVARVRLHVAQLVAVDRGRDLGEDAVHARVRERLVHWKRENFVLISSWCGAKWNDGIMINVSCMLPHT